MSDDLTCLGIEAAARGMASGAFDAVELLEAYLARIERLDRRLNCYVTLTPETARAEAERAALRTRTGKRLGRLDGIPIAVKDNIDVAGLPTTNGLGWPAAVTPAADAAVVAGLRAAGAVLLGKLNMHEGALGATTDNPHHGRTGNPWRADFTPGGSSGGSGAAVAAHLAAAALGSDTMGSVRLPAAYCGVVGLKPSTGRYGQAGVRLLCPELDQVGPLARTVADAASLHWTMAGTAPETADAGFKGLRVGVVANFEDVALDADIANAFRSVLEGLSARGAAVRRFEVPGYQPTLARRAGLLMVEADGWHLHEAAIARWPEAFSPEFTGMLVYGRDAEPERVGRARQAVHELGAAFRALLAEVDAIVSPTAAETAFAFDTPAPPGQADLTAPANFAGAPALSLPMGLSSDGLPMALQLMTAPGAEARLLALAAAVEAQLPAIGRPNDR